MSLPVGISRVFSSEFGKLCGHCFHDLKEERIVAAARRMTNIPSISDCEPIAGYRRVRNDGILYNKYPASSKAGVGSSGTDKSMKRRDKYRKGVIPKTTRCFSSDNAPHIHISAGVAGAATSSEEMASRSSRGRLESSSSRNTISKEVHVEPGMFRDGDNSRDPYKTNAKRIEELIVKRDECEKMSQNPSSQKQKYVKQKVKWIEEELHGECTSDQKKEATGAQAEKEEGNRSLVTETEESERLRSQNDSMNGSVISKEQEEDEYMTQSSEFSSYGITPQAYVSAGTDEAATSCGAIVDAERTKELTTIEKFNPAGILHPTHRPLSKKIRLSVGVTERAPETATVERNGYQKMSQDSSIENLEYAKQRAESTEDELYGKSTSGESSKHREQETEAQIQEEGNRPLVIKTEERQESRSIQGEDDTEDEPISKEPSQREKASHTHEVVENVSYSETKEKDAIEAKYEENRFSIDETGYHEESRCRKDSIFKSVVQKKQEEGESAICDDDDTKEETGEKCNLGKDSDRQKQKTEEEKRVSGDESSDDARITEKASDNEDQVYEPSSEEKNDAREKSTSVELSREWEESDAGVEHVVLMVDDREEQEKVGEEEQMFRTRRNEQLDEIKPCRNASRGCNQTFTPSEMVIHDAVCRFQEASCEFPDCSWNGNLFTYILHFLMHPQDFCFALGDNFKLQQWYTAGSHRKLIYTSCGMFQIFWKVSSPPSGTSNVSLYFTILDLRLEPKVISISFMLMKGQLVREITKLKTSTKLLDINYDEEDETIYRFDNIEPSGKLQVSLRSMDRLFRLRNHMLADLRSPSNIPLRSSLYLCRFLSADRYHESDFCSFHPWQCPVNGCNVKPLHEYVLFIRHLLVHHNVTTIERNALTDSRPIDKNTHEEFFFIQFAKLFFLKHIYYEYVHMHVFHLIYVGPKKGVRFDYEITIEYGSDASSKKKNKKFRQECNYVKITDDCYMWTVRPLSRSITQASPTSTTLSRASEQPTSKQSLGSRTEASSTQSRSGTLSGSTSETSRKRQSVKKSLIEYIAPSNLVWSPNSRPLFPMMQKFTRPSIPSTSSDPTSKASEQSIGSATQVSSEQSRSGPLSELTIKEYSPSILGTFAGDASGRLSRTLLLTRSKKKKSSGSISGASGQSLPSTSREPDRSESLETVHEQVLYESSRLNWILFPLAGVRIRDEYCPPGSSYRVKVIRTADSNEGSNQ